MHVKLRCFLENLEASLKEWKPSNEMSGHQAVLSAKIVRELREERVEEEKNCQTDSRHKRLFIVSRMLSIISITLFYRQYASIIFPYMLNR